MEALLKRELGCDFVKATGHSGGGCISQGQSYDTDKGRVFVKVNSKAEVGAAAGRVRVGGRRAASGRGSGPGSGVGGRGSGSGVGAEVLKARRGLPAGPRGGGARLPGPLGRVRGSRGRAAS